MISGDRGAWAEMVVGADLLKLGLQPFRAISPAAPCDFLVLVDGLALSVEVRSVCVRASRPWTPMTNWHGSRAQVGAYVFPDGEVAYSPPLLGCGWEAVRINKSGIERRATQ